MATGLLNVSLSGLNAAMSGIRTVQQNIANANTPGYHRQQAVLTAAQPQFSGGGYMGTGVNVETVRRVYDQFLDTQTRNYQSQLSGSEAYSAYATQVDALLGSEATGLGSVLGKFFDSVNEVANDPTSATARQLMLSSGGAVAARFNMLSDQLQGIRISINKEVGTVADQINNYSEQIRALNSQITRGIGAGQAPNDLIDQREQVISELGKLVNVSSVDQGDGSVTVMLGRGQPLVVGSSVRYVEAIDDPANTAQKTLAFDGLSATPEVVDPSDITGGRLGGLFTFREDMLNPSLSDLDDLAQSLADAFNAQHVQGDDLAGNQGTNFFSYTASAPAATLGVAISQTDLIAAAGDGNGPGDNSNAVTLADIRMQALASLGGMSLSDYNIAMIGRNATHANSSDIDVANYTSLYQHSYDAQQAVSGVNLDEEAVNLIQYQQAYQASAKAIQTSTALFDAVLSALR